MNLVHFVAGLLVSALMQFKRSGIVGEVDIATDENGNYQPWMFVTVGHPPQKYKISVMPVEEL